MGRRATGSTPPTCPTTSSRLGTKAILTIPILTIIALVVLGVVGYYLHTARGGRELYAIGSDPAAAKLYGLPVTPPGALARSSSVGRSPGWPGSSTPPATAP